MNKEIKLANPRGFCAGVDRAIDIVNKALDIYGAPVYVKHEVVHNKVVVNDLKDRGAIFVEDISEIPDDSLVIFSAHGVSSEVEEITKLRNLNYFDATCPLVTKVHMEVRKHAKASRDIILIGHEGHPEVEGTAGQLQDIGNLTLVQNIEDVEKLYFPSNQNLAYITQTTLSVLDTKEIVDALKLKFPSILEPKKSDICYATSNRQESVQEMAKKVEAIFVIGAFNSSNSIRLVETAKRFGCKHSELIENIDDFDYSNLSQYNEIGLTASASAPEEQLDLFISRVKNLFSIEVLDHYEDENIIFKVPNYLN